GPIVTLSLGLFTEPGPPVIEGAGFWIRGLARIIDMVVDFVAAGAAAISAVFLVTIGSVISETPPDATLDTLSLSTPLGLVAALVGSTVMHTLAEGLHGSTLGKRLCGLTVISEDGKPADLVASFKRNLAYFLDSLFFGYLAAQKMGTSLSRQR